jgi:23S rRNA (uracil1939-C5)-methyltransferase
MTERVSIEITSIAAGGDGVGRHDGLVVFVPRTAPGDLARVAIEPGKRFARGRLEQLERASPARVAATCPHYEGDGCGGCQLQHMAIEAQREAKRTIVADTLRRLGKRTVDAPAIHSGPSPWRYRHRLSLAMRRDTAGRWTAGLHAAADPSRVFALKDCLITHERVVALWREIMAAGAHLPDAPALRGTVRLVGDRGAFVLEGARAWPAAQAFVDGLPSFDHVWWQPEGGRRRRVGAASGEAPPYASFSQVNPDVASELWAFVDRRVMAYAPSHVVDAYAGTGNLAIALHGRGIRVSAIERDEDAVAWAAARLGKPSRAIAAATEDALADCLPADVVVLNPPRAGVDARVAYLLERATPAPRAIVYVSCDPATLARDLARLSSWTVAGVTAFDMFPQTAHVETVVELTRSAA